jgi:hypothetical protein
MTIVLFLVAGVIVGLFIVRRVKIALGIPVLGDGHLLKKWKERRRLRWGRKR